MNDEILKRLDALAAKLGVAADHLWGVLIRQARIEAIQDTLFVVFTAIFTYVLMKIWVHISKKGLEDWADDHVPQMIGMIIASAACVVFIAVAAIDIFSEIPTELFNPEYWALKQLIPK